MKTISNTKKQVENVLSVHVTGSPIQYSNRKISLQKIYEERIWLVEIQFNRKSYTMFHYINKTINNNNNNNNLIKEKNKIQPNELYAVYLYYMSNLSQFSREEWKGGHIEINQTC